VSENIVLLKRRIATARNIAQVARAMEMISASKIRKAKETVALNKPYAREIVDLTTRILRQTDRRDFTHPYLSSSPDKGTLLLVISPDKGLCGALNSNLARKYAETAGEGITMIALGKKARTFCRASGCSLAGELTIGTTLPPYSIVYRLIEIINAEYNSGNVSSFKILYTDFVSLYSQVPTVFNVLPIDIPSSGGDLPYVFEPDSEEVLRVLLPYYLEVVLYETIIEAFTSEHAARMMAMNNAKTNANEMDSYLTLLYNKSRQEKITNELQVLANYV
jgi:F-type H+-transporting ATPase subunit gamma